MRVLFIVIVSAAAALALWGEVPHALLRGFERSQIFGAFLPSVLLLSATVESSPRLDELRTGLGRLDSNAAQNWTLYGSHALGAVLNVGALSILAPVAARGADAAHRTLLASSAARGVGTAVMWSPFFVAIAFTSQLVPRVPVWQVMAVGVGLAVIGLALCHVLYTPGLDRAGFRASVAELRPLVIPVGAIVAAVVAASVAFHWSGLQSVAIVVPVFCLGYLATLGSGAAKRAARRTLDNFARLADELLIIVGATMLGTVVAALPAVHALGASVTPGMISGVALMAALVFVLVGLGQAGLHPMIGNGILLPVIAAGPFGICSRGAGLHGRLRVGTQLRDLDVHAAGGGLVGRLRCSGKGAPHATQPPLRSALLDRRDRLSRRRECRVRRILRRRATPILEGTNMSDTPVTDEYKRRGDWNPLWDQIRELDPQFMEAYLRFRDVPHRNGHLPAKFRELILVAVNAATTHLYAPGVRRHMANAFKAGATREEVLETIQLITILGIHSANVAIPILAEEYAKFEAAGGKTK